MTDATKRKIDDMLRGLLGSGFHGNQERICQVLEQHGFPVTQSTVSRTLRKMGALKTMENGRVVYQLPKEKPLPNYTGSLRDLIISVDHNESLIVLKTTPGSAMFLAGFLDHTKPSGVLGTMAGVDIVFIAPRSTRKITQVIKELDAFLK